MKYLCDNRRINSPSAIVVTAVGVAVERSVREIVKRIPADEWDSSTAQEIEQIIRREVVLAIQSMPNSAIAAYVKAQKERDGE